MPTYSYACTACGDRFDVVQAFTDDALTTCKQCAGQLRKRFNSVGIVFKGSGFYRNDSRESGKKSTSSNGAPTTDSAAATSEKSSGSSENGSVEKSSTSSTNSKPSTETASKAAATSA